jgi:4-hydroxybenzoate polyprenyltransferase
MTGGLARWWVYQAERFPLIKTVPLLAMFSAASISVSAVLAGRPVPGLGAYAIGFGMVFLLFFQLRVCDEIKDAEDDRRYRPERPIPRGLVTLREVVILGILTLPMTIALTLIWGSGLIWLLALVWVWLALMTAEFGAPDWLKARPVLYLVSHMAIMPLIDLLVTGVEWLPHGAPHPSLAWFVALSFANGCVLELGRKLWAAESERNGVDSYSRLWGPRLATAVWLGFVALSFALLCGVGLAVGHVAVIACIGLFGVAACLWAGLTYARTPDLRAEKRVDLIAGLWVFLCYSTAGFVPLALRAV